MEKTANKRILPTFTPQPSWGYFCSVSAQFIWGGFPYFYSFLKSIDSLTLVAHRCLWGFFFVVLWMLYHQLYPKADKRPIHEFLWAIRSPKTLGLVLMAAFFSGLNWIAFVWAVTNGRALEASLGYYICPQVHVLLGVLILGERLNRRQWMAVAFSGIGVAYIASFSTGFPWIGLLLATAFGLYGLIKKKIPLSAPPGLTLETGMMLPVAIGYLAFTHWGRGDPLLATPSHLNLLLIGSGFLTVAPLALYGTAVRHIPLSTVGLLQFIGPTLQFLCGVFLLGETFDRARLIGFIFVWIGLALFLASNRRPAKKVMAVVPPPLDAAN